MAEPIAQVLTELRNANVASKRVRTGEPAGQGVGFAGDEQGPSAYQRFVVLSMLGRTRLARGSVQRVLIGYRAYGVTFADASSLAHDIATALHLAGGRGSGASWIYQSVEESGGSASKDPVTRQPYESGVISLIATT